MSSSPAARICLMGWPLGHSVSPAMQNAAFAATGLDWEYEALPVPPEQLGDTVNGLGASGFRGANVTIPHKHAVLACCSSASPEATAIGAANTLVLESGRIAAHNTDCSGFARALAEAGCKPRTALVLGAGGAARAVVHALLGMGAAVVIAARSPAKARGLQAMDGSGERLRFVRLDASSLAAAVSRADLLVNTTPVGMWPQVGASPLPPDVPLAMGLTVMDLIYNPVETALLHLARAAGARTIGGLGMLVHQGAAAFQLWTGLEAPLETMRHAAESALADIARAGHADGDTARRG